MRTLIAATVIILAPAIASAGLRLHTLTWDGLDFPVHGELTALVDVPDDPGPFGSHPILEATVNVTGLPTLDITDFSYASLCGDDGACAGNLLMISPRFVLDTDQRSYSVDRRHDLMTNMTWTQTSVPEPSAFLLLLIPVLAFIAIAWHGERTFRGMGRTGER